VVQAKLNRYEAGTMLMPNGNKVCALWKNEIFVSNSNPAQDVEVHDLAVKDSTFYTCGEVQLSTAAKNTQAMMWANNVPTLLPSKSYNSTANAICVANGNVYVLGAESDFGLPPVAVLWINGVSTRLILGAISNSGVDMLIEGTDVYALAYQTFVNNNNTELLITKNGNIIQRITSTSEIYGYRFAKSGNTFYAVGSSFDATASKFIPKYWKNEVSYLINGFSNSEVKGIALHNDSMFACGYRTNIDQKYTPCFWYNTFDPVSNLKGSLGSSAEDIVWHNNQIYAVQNADKNGDSKFKSFLTVTATTNYLGNDITEITNPNNYPTQVKRIIVKLN
jgi:hypothetical protein